MGSQVVEKELRLVAVISEARLLLREMRAENERLTKIAQSLTKQQQKEKAECMALIESVNKKISELKKEMHASSQVANQIAGHYKWKNAICALWGQEGVDACISWMENERETREADEAETRVSIA